MSSHYTNRGITSNQNPSDFDFDIRPDIHRNADFNMKGTLPPWMVKEMHQNATRHRHRHQPSFPYPTVPIVQRNTNRPPLPNVVAAQGTNVTDVGFDFSTQQSQPLQYNSFPFSSAPTLQRNANGPPIANLVVAQGSSMTDASTSFPIPHQQASTSSMQSNNHGNQAPDPVELAREMVISAPGKVIDYTNWYNTYMALFDFQPGIIILIIFLCLGFNVWVTTEEGQQVSADKLSDYQKKYPQKNGTAESEAVMNLIFEEYKRKTAIAAQKTQVEKYYQE